MMIFDVINLEVNSTLAHRPVTLGRRAAAPALRIELSSSLMLSWRRPICATSPRLSDASIRRNFLDRGLDPPLLIVSDVAALDGRLDDEEYYFDGGGPADAVVADAIVCDPPYGVRERVDVGVEGAAPWRPALFELAAKRLRAGRRLAFWMPSSIDAAPELPFAARRTQAKRRGTAIAPHTDSAEFGGCPPLLQRLPITGAQLWAELAPHPCAAATARRRRHNRPWAGSSARRSRRTRTTTAAGMCGPSSIKRRATS